MGTKDEKIEVLTCHIGKVDIRVDIGPEASTDPSSLGANTAIHLIVRFGKTQHMLHGPPKNRGYVSIHQPADSEGPGQHSPEEVSLLGELHNPDD